MNLNAPRQLTGFVFHFFQLHRRRSSPSTVQRHRGAALDAAGHLVAALMILLPTLLYVLVHFLLRRLIPKPVRAW